MQVSTLAMLSCSAMTSEASSRLLSAGAGTPALPGMSAGLRISMYSVSLSIFVPSWLRFCCFIDCCGSVAMLRISRRGLRGGVVLFCFRIGLLFVVTSKFFENFVLGGVVRDGRGEALQLPVEKPRQFGAGPLVDAGRVFYGRQAAFVSMRGETLELIRALGGNRDGS